MGLYARYVLPKLIDNACGQRPMAKLRARHVPTASGNVLEIGLGSGHNLPHYGDTVASVVAVDPAAELTDLARERIEDVAMPVEVINCGAQELPFDNDVFDTIVSTWTLCSIPDVDAALDQLRRVIKPNGKFIFIEHGQSPDPDVHKWQRRIEPIWKRIGGGCHLTRNAPELITAHGFAIDRVEAGYLPGPRWGAYTYRGVATIC